MPELPEVETIRRGLTTRIMGQKIEDLEVLCSKSFIGDRATVVGSAIKGIRRFGKALVIDLSEGRSLMIHLRMTGQLIFDPTNDSRYAAGHPSENFLASLPNRQTRVVITLTNVTLFFNDQRKFGFIKVLPTDTVLLDPFIRKLAKEPWSMEPGEFYAKLQKHNTPIKAAILDQTIIAGLGNIYADESLFMSRIHPARPASSLSEEEARELLESARTVMTRSIESGGSTMATYVRADGSRGDYLEKFAQVFRREGQKCPRCGAMIEKTRVAGRGTHYCPVCQPAPEGWKPQ